MLRARRCVATRTRPDVSALVDVLPQWRRGWRGTQTPIVEGTIVKSYSRFERAF